MYIARKLKEDNIAGYLLYMWQVEDILRAHHLDMDELRRNYLTQFRMTDDAEKEAEEWYANLIRMMREEGVQEHGHLQINKNIVLLLTDLHHSLLHSTKHPVYAATYYKAPALHRGNQEQGRRDRQTGTGNLLRGALRRDVAPPPTERGQRRHGTRSGRHRQNAGNALGILQTRQGRGTRVMNQQKTTYKYEEYPRHRM